MFCVSQLSSALSAACCELATKERKVTNGQHPRARIEWRVVADAFVHVAETASVSTPSARSDGGESRLFSLLGATHFYYRLEQWSRWPFIFRFWQTSLGSTLRPCLAAAVWELTPGQPLAVTVSFIRGGTTASQYSGSVGGTHSMQNYISIW